MDTECTKMMIHLIRLVHPHEMIPGEHSCLESLWAFADGYDPDFDNVFEFEANPRACCLLHSSHPSIVANTVKGITHLAIQLGIEPIEHYASRD